MNRQNAADRTNAVRGADDNDAFYVTGWAISGAVTLATILIVWHLGI